MIPIQINLPEMVHRVEHGFHLSNEEARWLLAHIGHPVPRKKRCNACNATGEVPVSRESVCVDVCQTCHGEGFKPAEEPEFNVIHGCECDHPPAIFPYTVECQVCHAVFQAVDQRLWEEEESG